MRNLKCTIIPIIIGATGKVTGSLRKNLEAVPGKHSIDSLQKTAVLGTSHIIRNTLQCEAWSLSGGDHSWFKRSTRKKRPVTRDIHIYNNNIYCALEADVILIIPYIVKALQIFLNWFNPKHPSGFNSSRIVCKNQGISVIATSLMRHTEHPVIQLGLTQETKWMACGYPCDLQQSRWSEAQLTPAAVT